MQKKRKAAVIFGTVLALTFVLAGTASAEESSAKQTAAKKTAADDKSSEENDLWKDTAWKKKAVTNADDYANIRSGASVSTDAVGVLLPGRYVEIVEEKDGWTKIRSGSVEGYIRSDLLVSGKEAREEFVAANGYTGTVDASALNVRSGASTTHDVIGCVGSGEAVVLKDKVDGWYKIEYAGVPAYVSEEFVVSNAEKQTAMTLEEYDAYVEAERQAYEAQLAAAAQAEQAAVLSGDLAYASDLTGLSDAWTDVTMADSTDWSAYGTDAYGYTDYTDYSADAAAEYTDDAAYDTGYEETYTEPVYTEPVSASASELDLLAAIIQCEAGGESREGKVAVGACVLNRVASGSFPDNITDVVYQSGQFTPAMTGLLDGVLAEGARADCYEAAQAALNGENPIGDLLFFHAGGGDGLTIGNQTFY